MGSETTIPVFLFDEVVSHHGLFITRLTASETAALVNKPIHRDDHYIFIIQEQGKSSLLLDFKEVEIMGPALLCVLPGQVHRAIVVENTIAWFIAAKAEFINEQHRFNLEEQSLISQTTVLIPSKRAILYQTLSLLLNAWSLYKIGDLNAEVIRSIADAVFGMIAQKQDSAVNVSISRPMVISRSFKALITKHYKTIKAPSDYAKMLNISYAYLYEIMKEITGFSPNYWIREAVITEAKRLLFFTDLSIKEISSQLGFDDHNYFSRVFTKLSGLSPQRFRQHSRE